MPNCRRILPCRRRTRRKRFYQTIGIRARYNPTVRRTNCPKRYWACMTELQDER